MATAAAWEIGSAIVGTAATVSGAQQQASAENQMYQYQAAVAQNNKAISAQNATLALQAGQQQEAKKREDTAQMISSMVGGLTAAGIDPTSPTSLRNIKSTAQLGETDALTIRTEAQNASTDFRNDGLNFGAQAQLAQNAANNALTAGSLNAWGSFASGTGQVAQKWYKYFG